MVFSDRTIKEELGNGRTVISPLDPNDILPASVDLHLDRNILVVANSRRPYTDVEDIMEDLTQMVEVQEDSPFNFHPGEFVLGSTLENVELPADLAARLEGKSSLVIHSTASRFHQDFAPQDPARQGSDSQDPGRRDSGQAF